MIIDDLSFSVVHIKNFHIPYVFLTMEWSGYKYFGALLSLRNIVGGTWPMLITTQVGLMERPVATMIVARFHRTYPHI